MAMKDSSECSEPEKKRIEYGPELCQMKVGKRCCKATDSATVRNLGEGQPSLFFLQLLQSVVLDRRQLLACCVHRTRATTVKLVGALVPQTKVRNDLESDRYRHSRKYAKRSNAHGVTFRPCIGDHNLEAIPILCETQVQIR